MKHSDKRSKIGKVIWFFLSFHCILSVEIANPAESDNSKTRPAHFPSALELLHCRNYSFWLSWSLHFTACLGYERGVWSVRGFNFAYRVARLLFLRLLPIPFQHGHYTTPVPLRQWRICIQEKQVRPATSQLLAPIRTIVHSYNPQVVFQRYFFL